MPTNPVSAFLQGFAVVDQLETNRQNREFKREQRSRLHTLWQREDDEYARLKLNRYRADKAAEFDAITSDIMTGITGEIDAFDAIIADSKSTDEQRTTAQQGAEALRTKWFGADQLHNLINEAWKRQIARDPEFGEHMSLALGKDAAAGPLVRDKMRPVSGVGVIPPNKFPGANDGGIFIEVDATGGNGPLTHNRTSSPNDRVFLGKAGMTELIRVYGRDAVSDKYAIMGVLRERIGGNDFTGNPTQSIDQAQQGKTKDEQFKEAVANGLTPTLGDSTVGPDVPPLGDTNASPPPTGDVVPGSATSFEPVPPQDPSTLAPTTDEVEAQRIAAQARAEEDRQLDPLLGPQSGSNLVQLLRQEEGIGQPPGFFDATDPTIVNNGPVFPGDPQGARIPGFLENALSRTEGALDAAINRRQLDTSTAQGKGAQLTRGFSDAINIGAQTGLGIGEDAVALASGSGIGAFVVGVVTGDDGSTTTQAPPDDASQINAASSQGKGPSVGETTAGSPTTQEVVDKTPGAATPEVATNVANSLFNNQGQGRPPPEEVYKAYMMSKAGLLTLPEVAHFKRTGQLGKSAEVKWVHVGNGTLAATTSDGRVSFVQAPGSGGGGIATVQEQQGVLNLLQDSTAGLYEDNPRGQQQFIDATEGAYTLLGLPGDTPQQLNLRGNQANINMMQRGAKMIQQFDEDLVQTFDLPWPFDPDFKVPMRSGTLALAATLSKSGVSGATQGTHALRSYLERLSPMMGSDSALIAKAAEVETLIARARGSGGPFTVEIKGKTITLDPSTPDHKLREEIIEALILQNAGQ